MRRSRKLAEQVAFPHVWPTPPPLQQTAHGCITAQVHNRMPFILRPRDYDRWLDRGQVPQPSVALLQFCGTEAMQAAKAHPKVGEVRNNGPEMLQGPDDEDEPLSVLNSS